MSGPVDFTRRSMLTLSGLAAAGALAQGVLRPSPARSVGDTALPVPQLLEPRKGEILKLALRKGRHSFGAGKAVPTLGISGEYLSPVVRVRCDEDVAFEVRNQIGEVTSLHWHGLEIPSTVDGGPHNEIRPGDTWADTLPIRQPAATTWFHPHPHGATGRQVYGGLAGMMIIADGGDRERGLPSTYGVDDLPIILQDKRFDRTGAPVYNPGMMDRMHGFQGDVLLVNGVTDPVATVPAGFVRLRVLNGANARNFNLRLSDRRTFWSVAGDGGLLAKPIELASLLIAPGERYELLVDFSNGRPASLVNDPDPAHGDMGMTQQSGSTRLMDFRPNASRKADILRLPGALATLAEPDVKHAAAWRTFRLNAMGRNMGINGKPYDMDRLDFTAKLGATEIWEIISADMPHPFHVHGASFRILSSNGERPAAHQAGWKDVILVEEHAEILVRFNHPASAHHPFMYHCHILEHEDQGMMGQFAVA